MPVPDQAGGPRGSGPAGSAGSAGSAGFGVPVGMSPRLVRSARFWLRAYPRRWRAARGEEVLGLLADLAGPGDGRVDARTAVNLVRSGWATRWREHPPLGPWLLYRILDRRMPGHLGWVRDDIAGRWLPLRANLGVAAVFLVVTMIYGPSRGCWVLWPVSSWARPSSAVAESAGRRSGSTWYRGPANRCSRAATSRCRLVVVA